MFVARTKFKGMYSLRRANEIPEGFCAYSLNSNLGSSSTVGPEKGYSSFGNQANTTDSIVRKYTYCRGDGSETMLQVRDNGSNYIVEYLNTGDVRNSTDGEWSILETGLTRTRTTDDGVVGKARIDFAPFNDTGSNQLVYGNGFEALRIWNGAVGVISSTTVNTIVLTGTLTLAQRGFAASGSVIINGIPRVYTGIANQTFTGVTTDPTGEPNGSGVAQIPDTLTLNAIDKGSILLSTQSRLFLAGIEATPNQVTYSDVGDITNYTGTNPSDGGFEDFPQLNGAITGMSYLGEWIIVGSEKKIIAFKFDFPSSTTKTTRVKDVADEGFASYKSIKRIGSKIIYTTPSGGQKQLTQVGDQDLFDISDLSEPIRPSIKNFVWDDSAMEYNPKNRVIMVSGKSSSDIGVNDKVIAYYLSLDENGQQSVNIDIKDWFIGDMCNFDGDLHFGGSVASQDYLAFDGYTKDGAPYIWRRIERIEQFGVAIERFHPQYLIVIGTISTGTTIYFRLKYDTNGKTTVQEMELNGDDERFVFPQALNTLGGFELGTEPLGGTIDDIDELNPYEVVFPLPHIYPRNIQLEMYTDGSGQRATVDTYGYEVVNSDQHITADEQSELGN